ncbi:MAG: chromate transporter [Bacteroidales bacterium]
MIYLQIFISFFKIGIFGFGGGAAMISFFQYELVDKYGWISAPQLTDMIAVSQMTPGPIGINCATYAGYLATGTVWGSFIATFAIVLPSFIIMILLTRFVAKYANNLYIEKCMQILRPTVIGLIGAAVFSMLTEDTFGPNYSNISSWIIFIVSLFLLDKIKLNPLILIVAAAVIGLIIY